MKHDRDKGMIGLDNLIKALGLEPERSLNTGGWHHVINCETVKNSTGLLLLISSSSSRNRDSLRFVKLSDYCNKEKNIYINI